jgi:hypothetical protein
MGGGHREVRRERAVGIENGCGVLKNGWWVSKTDDGYEKTGGGRW